MSDATLVPKIKERLAAITRPSKQQFEQFIQFLISHNNNQEIMTTASQLIEDQIVHNKRSISSALLIDFMLEEQRSNTIIQEFWNEPRLNRMLAVLWISHHESKHIQSLKTKWAQRTNSSKSNTNIKEWLASLRAKKSEFVFWLHPEEPTPCVLCKQKIDLHYDHFNQCWVCTGAIGSANGQREPLCHAVCFDNYVNTIAHITRAI